MKLRHSARAIILDEHDRVLLCRFGVPHPAVPAGATFVWAAPGGGIEPGETPLGALHRCQDITDYRGTDLFSPRELATPLIALITDGVPDIPVRLGL